MGYKTKTIIANKVNYSSTKRSKDSIDYLVIHYTANDCDNAINNARYFQNIHYYNNKVVKSSANFFVDDEYVVTSVDPLNIAYAVGGGLKDQGSKYKSKGAKYYGKCTNSNSISIELCDTTKDGKHTVSKKTRDNATTLAAKLLKKYNIPIDRMIRHFDVNGKLCPIYFVTNEDDWNKFKKEVKTKMGKTTSSNASSTNKKYPAIAKPTLRKGDRGNEVKNLQSDLNYIMGIKLATDGIFGVGTENALKNFQKKYKLTIDGIYGKASATKMQSLIKK